MKKTRPATAAEDAQQKRNWDAVREKDREDKRHPYNTKKIPDATLIGKTTNDIEVEDAQFIEGDKDTPPLELDEQTMNELAEEEKKKEEKQKEIRNATIHYTNGENEWKLIAKTYNNLLDWEHVTTAMQVGSGILVCIKEAIGQRMTSTVTYAPNMMLWKNNDDKWEISERQQY